MFNADFKQHKVVIDFIKVCNNFTSKLVVLLLEF